MTRRLPPLNGLRAFEAAGRHLSFTRAATELNVTPGAISQQIKMLEDYLGVRLFKRLKRSLLLTDAGQASLPRLSEGLDRIAEAVDLVRVYEAHHPLTVSVAPSFASKWLVPRLARFQALQPDINVRIDASARPMDLTHEDIDLSIRFGPGDYPGMRVTSLFTQEVFPVCSPRLLQGEYPLRAPADLARHTLLHYDYPHQDPTWPDWTMWLAAAGVSGVDSTRGPQFTQHEIVIQAAIDGQGVALVGSVSVADDLYAGRLVRPFELSFPIHFAYFIVCPEARAEQPRIQAFSDWLLEEVHHSRGSPGAPDRQ